VPHDAMLCSAKPGGERPGLSSSRGLPQRVHHTASPLYLCLQVMSVKLMGATADMLAFPHGVDQGYAELCRACWAEPEQRPSAQQLDEALDQLALKLLGRRMMAVEDKRAPGPSASAA
jgi:hypothetical protein